MAFRRLFVDIETSPNVGYFWQPGYSVNLSYQSIKKERAIICICYKWEDHKEAKSLTWDKGCDKKMLARWADIVKGADEVVAHNGDKFDMAHIRTRCMFHGIKLVETYTQVDTLKIARYRYKFNSNRLDYLGKALGVGGKIQTPPDLWDRVMDGSRKALREMVDYCKRDVVMLQDIYTRLAGYHKATTHIGVAAGGDRLTCPHCGCAHTKVDKTRTTAAGMVRREMQCKGCGRYWTVADGTYRSVMKVREMMKRKDD